MRVPLSKESIRGRQVLDEINKGKAVRPNREDGYTNVLNKFGTKQDNSEAYVFQQESYVPDYHLTTLYEGNGLFAKIVDTPAEEAVKHGFDLNLKNDELVAFTEEALDILEWEEKATAAIKWARLYGGSIIVMLIDDGKGLEDPVDWENVRSIDELRVFERAVVQPDYVSLYLQDYGNDGKKNRISRFGEPEFYYVNSMFGSFKVHESRCLVFKNGILPEQVSQSTYQFWGMPEYVRIKRALRETTTAHTDAVKLLERSVQAIYSMKNLAQLLATEQGENEVLKRLEVIDMARGLLNSIAIDAEGETYDFKTFQFSGVKDVIESTCNMLSALTNIPQTILFGRSPTGMNATGESDLENYYNFVERIQKLMLKRNFRYLLDVIYRAGVSSGELQEEPEYKLSFNPLWSLSETEEAAVEQTRAATALTKAQTAQIYVDMQSIDPSEVRRKLASNEEFDVEDIVEEDDDSLYNSLFGEHGGVTESDVEAAEKNLEQAGASGGTEQSAPAPVTIQPPGTVADEIKKDEDEPNSVGVLIIKDGRMLTGIRKSEFCPYKICGAGGHIEEGETPEEAAIRETQEEFGITPKDLTPIGVRVGLPKEYGVPMYYLSTDYDGKIKCDDRSEMVAPQMTDLGEVLKMVQGENDNLFLPFADSIRMLSEVLYDEVNNSYEDEKLKENALPSGEESVIIYRRADDFVESDHPRDESGKFTSGSGSSGGSSSGEKTTESTKEEPEESSEESTGEGSKKSTSEGSKESAAKATEAGAEANAQTGATQSSGEGKQGSTGNANAPRPVSSQGENDSCKGFSTPELLAKHHNKHSWEFGYSSEKEYLEAGIEFLQQPCGGDIIGYSTKKGKVVRYNTKTTEYASGFPNQNLCTYMKAKVKNNGTANHESAMAYYERRKKKDGGK